MATIATVTTAAVLAAGCTSSSQPPAPPPPSPQPTIAPPSPAALSAVTEALEATTTTSATVGFDLSPSQVFGPAQAPIVGTGSFDFVAADGHAQLQQPTGPEAVVFLPASVFVHQANGPTILPRGKSWVSAGLTETALATNFPQFVIQAEALNPVFLLQQAVWGAVAAAPLGPSTVDGRATQGYLVTVDLSRVTTAASGPAAAAFVRATGYQLNALSTTIPAGSTTDQVRVWVDDAGRVVRYQASPPGAGAGTISVTLGSFGTPVRVSPPSRKVVADIASLSPGGERENAGGGDSDGA